MSPSKVLLLFLIVVLISDVASWRRRRRRRSPPPCARRNCATSWGAWSACNCLGQRTRTLKITVQPLCGGSACPLLTTQGGSCNSGQCSASGGRCNVQTKKCVCNAGKTGARCRQNCLSGTYGINCQNKCDCATGISCDPVQGYCKCPIGRSGQRCQYRYLCSRRYQCYTLKPTLVKYNYCFLQQHITSYSRSAYSTCPRKTHYVNRCLCYNNCVPASVSDSLTCKCKCHAPNSSKTPSYYRGKYVTSAICCPRYPYI